MAAVSMATEEVNIMAAVSMTTEEVMPTVTDEVNIMAAISMTIEEVMTTDEVNTRADVSMTTEEVNQTTSTTSSSSLEMASVSGLPRQTSDTGKRSQIPKDKPKLRARAKPIRKRPCKFYQAGKCRYGDRCWLPHDSCTISGPEAQYHEQESSTNVEVTLQSQPSTVSTSGIAGNAGNTVMNGDYTAGSEGNTAKEGLRTLENGHVTTSENGQTTAGKKSASGVLCTAEGQTEVNGAVAACKFYARTGRCHFGKQCRYTHCSVSSKVAENPAEDSAGVKNEAVRSHPPQSSGKTSAPITTQIGPKRTSDQRRKTCRYFKVGTCKMGDGCKFRHPLGSAQSEVCSVVNDQHPDVPSAHQGSSCEPIKQEASRKPNMRSFIGGFKKLCLDKLSADDLEKMRQTEIEQLKKRYPKASETTDDPAFYKFIFVPSDPDWPYDVKELFLGVSFLESYPAKVMLVDVPAQNLPLPVKEWVEECIATWLGEKSSKMKSTGKVELMFRPFLRWLDRNLEAIFTSGLKQYKRQLIAKAAGLQFIPASELQKQHNVGSQEELATESSETSEIAGNSSAKTPGERTNDGGIADSSDKTANGDLDVMPGQSNDLAVNALIEPARRGIEVKLQRLRLGENVATVTVTNVHVIVQCARCHALTDVATVTTRVNSVQCAKCCRQQLVAFRPSIIHAFSPVLGYLDLDGCVAFDIVLLECIFLLACLNCSEETKLRGLATGQQKDLWCQSCHQKMAVAVESVRFAQLQPTLSLDSTQAHTIDVKLIRRVARDPAIQPGSPLPADGTCKHYKKSYRWLRFPCCGKAYPCDKCHDEKEMDHEMKFANRMICGFCAKEQPFSPDALCTGCQSSLTRKKTSHWEGGSGCRDKIKMARGDAKKFASSSKTISRKAEEKTKSKPKTTKLRHQ